MCTFKNVSLCTGTTRTYVSTHVRVVMVHTGTLNVHTETCLVDKSGFSACHTHTPRPQRHTHHNTTTTTTPHGDRDRQRQRQRKKTGTERDVKTEETRQDKTRQEKTREEKTGQDKTRQDKTRQDKTRQDKRREKIHFQCGGWCSDFLVDSGLRTRLEPPKQCQVRFNLDFRAPWPVTFFIICELIFLCSYSFF